MFADPVAWTHAPMPRRPHPRPPETLPPDFLERHDLLHRLWMAPLAGLTPPHPWAPLTDAEWDWIRPHLPGTAAGEGGGPGRPMADARARLDAVFRAVTLKRPREQGGGRAPWRMLPEGFGEADTVSRTYRRWARAHLWARLLCLVSDKAAPTPLVLGLRWRICCAFRRAIRLMGLRALVLARRLGLYSALPAPSQHLPDPDLSEIFQPVIVRAMERAVRDPGWRPPRAAWRLFHDMHRLIGGRARIPRAMEPA
jgi:transposase